MRGLKYTLLIVALVAMTSSLVAQSTYYAKSGGGLNMRKGAGTNHSVVASIPASGAVKVIDKDNGEWWKVEYKGKQGYVSSKYLTEEKSEAAQSAKKSNSSNARTNKSSRSSQNNRSTQSRRSSSASSSASASAYDWGIGLRLGNPSGITVKRYKQNGKALEFSLGRTHMFDDDYYDDRFNDWYYDEGFGYADIQYLGYKVSSPIGLQVHYLIHKPINRLGDESVSGLDWYYGFGGQLRFQSYTYNYRYRLPGRNDWFYNTGEKETDVDLGADGVIGLEYTLPKAPVSFFLDATLFMEIVDDPFHFSLMGGIGARYRF
ncbi:SH3 domain-containing protein [Carboxylicivirga taeanensis]|uniref:SH3 domain-containing protein n=1 Tax=Carboxylicivirga taeanensis TaxID=1416875 RepID=UPI003F6E3BE6